jgi:hypothetical protein
MGDISSVLGDVDIVAVPVPYDCSDGFLGAYWRRPEAYLEPLVRRSMSTFSVVRNLDAALERLKKDLRSGRWARANADLLAQDILDVGYRIVIGRG